MTGRNGKEKKTLLSLGNSGNTDRLQPDETCHPEDEELFRYAIGSFRFCNVYFFYLNLTDALLTL